MITLFVVPAHQATQAGGIDSLAPYTFTNSGSGRIDPLESISGLLKSLQIRALLIRYTAITVYSPQVL
jgi:hypothetical protein